MEIYVHNLQYVSTCGANNFRIIKWNFVYSDIMRI